MNYYSKTVVALDVHKDSIVTGVLPHLSDKITDTARLGNTPGVIEKLARHMAERYGPVEYVYEAGPCGYEIQRQLTGMGCFCAVVAPGLIPVRATDRVKTDRRDAEKLARLWRAGELTAIRIPSREEEAARDLVRLREDALVDRLRARHRLDKFLLRQGRVFRDTKTWGVAHQEWLRKQKFEWESSQKTFEGYLWALDNAEHQLGTFEQQVLDLAGQPEYRTAVRYLSCFKGIKTISAITLLVGAQDFLRFDRAAAFMKFTGLTGWEHSSGDKVRRGGTSKCGNAHIRRVLGESAWSYRGWNVTGDALAKRRSGCPQEVVRLAQKAQNRLHRKFHRMISKNKPSPVAAVAVARELAGFIWSMAGFFPKAA